MDVPLPVAIKAPVDQVQHPDPVHSRHAVLLDTNGLPSKLERPWCDFLFFSVEVEFYDDFKTIVIIICNSVSPF